MSPSIRYGLILGIAVGAMGFLLPTLGLHTNLIMPTVFVLAAIVVNVVCVFLALRQSATTAAWATQVANALIVGGIGAVLIFASSWTMTVWVFTDYYAEYAAANREGLVALGLSPEEVARQMASIEGTSPVSSALSGAVGAVITSVVAGAVIGIFKRTGR